MFVYGFLHGHLISTSAPSHAPQFTQGKGNGHDIGLVHVQGVWHGQVYLVPAPPPALWSVD